MINKFIAYSGELILEVWRYMITSWYGNLILSAFLALCKRNPLVPSGFPSQKDNNVDLWCFLWPYPKQAVECFHSFVDSSIGQFETRKTTRYTFIFEKILFTPNSLFYTKRHFFFWLGKIPRWASFALCATANQIAGKSWNSVDLYWILYAIGWIPWILHQRVEWKHYNTAIMYDIYHITNRLKWSLKKAIMTWY